MFSYCFFFSHDAQIIQMMMLMNRNIFIYESRSIMESNWLVDMNSSNRLIRMSLKTMFRFLVYSFWYDDISLKKCDHHESCLFNDNTQWTYKRRRNTSFANYTLFINENFATVFFMLWFAMCATETKKNMWTIFTTDKWYKNQHTKNRGNDFIVVLLLFVNLMF